MRLPSCILGCLQLACHAGGVTAFSLSGAGLNSILFAINIDNKDLNGQSRFAPTVSDLLKESTQNVTSLLKESTQGVSSLFREITASSAVSILIRPEQETDPLPVVSKHVSVGERDRVLEVERRAIDSPASAKGSELWFMLVCSAYPHFF